MYENEQNPQVKLAGGAELYMFGHFIIKEEVKIFLTAMEIKLLSIFLSKPNVLLDVSFLVDEMNRMNDSVYSEQNVYILITRVRKKIEKDESKPKILVNLRPGYILNVI